MKYFLLLMLCATHLAANTDNLHQLITVTEENLKVQKKLLTEVEQFEEQQRLYLDDSENLEKLFVLAKTSKKILTEIEEYHLAHLFNGDFMKEVHMFAKFANNRGIPKP